MAGRGSTRYNVPKMGDDPLETSIPSTVRDLEPPLFTYPMLPYPDDAVVAGKTKGDSQVRIRSSDRENWGRSYENLRKGLYDDEMAEMGLPEDCQRIGVNDQTVEEADKKRKPSGRAVKRKKSRTLVKLRQPGDGCWSRTL